ncbi:outer membrane protein [Candidatus Cetobacterium colombiensis]|uniref:Porin n=1 Tax=Candidatus Cetobacterium colombiensis TaxID=3073100 RepID=A0ABU4WA47_9FUSO|nr:hypothetical protein [Candidatus Cetobacterium colombiensis]MDX8336079.1 hypothetical protein [Candidatus Cetobacterium colombiensis]
MNNKFISCLTLSSFLMINSSILAFDFSKAGGDIEVGFKVKDYEEGGASRNFREGNVTLTLKPNKDKGLAFKFGFADRVFNESKTSKNKEQSREMSEFYIENMYIWGKLMFRPEIGLKYTDFHNDEMNLDSAKEYRFYPKFTYTFNRNWSLYSRGFIGYTELKDSYVSKDWATGKINSESRYGYKHRLEGGARYTFNRKHALSVAYADDRNDVNKFDYDVDGSQIRFRYHYSPTRTLKLVPFFFWGIDGERVSTNGAKTDVKRDMLGVNTHYNITKNVELIAKVNYEWRDDNADVGGKGNKDHWFYSGAIKYSF